MDLFKTWIPRRELNAFLNDWCWWIFSSWIFSCGRLKDLVESFVLINTKALHPIRITLPLYNYNHGEKAKGRRNHVVEVSFDGGAREWIDIALSSCAETEFGCLSSWCTAINFVVTPPSNLLLTTSFRLSLSSALPPPRQSHILCSQEGPKESRQAGSPNPLPRRTRKPRGSHQDKRTGCCHLGENPRGCS